MFNLLNKKALLSASLIGVLASSSVMAAGKVTGIGRVVTDVEVAGWDIDVRPDGKGLPDGEGSVLAGESLYEAKCAACHGLFGEGEGRWPVLVGGNGTLTDERPTKTVGSYWPYASTLWDYTYRAMPFNAPRSLRPDETYAITAYILYMNEIIDDEDFVLNKDNLADIEMPNQDNFFVDPRPDVNNTRCMENCKDPESINIVNTIGGVTPVSHFVEGADGPAASHEEQERLEEQKEIERLRALGVEVEEKEIHASKEKGISEEAKAGQSTYDMACAACHAGGLAGSPKTGLVSSWEPRIAKGLDTLVDHAINGYQGDSGYMPAKGGRNDLSDEAVTNAVKYMVEVSQ